MYGAATTPSSPVSTPQASITSSSASSTSHRSPPPSATRPPPPPSAALPPTLSSSRAPGLHHPIVDVQNSRPRREPRHPRRHPTPPLRRDQRRAPYAHRPALGRGLHAVSARPALARCHARGGVVQWEGARRVPSRPPRVCAAARCGGRVVRVPRPLRRRGVCCVQIIYWPVVCRPPRHPPPPPLPSSRCTCLLSTVPLHSATCDACHHVHWRC
jgi:hypothetical protein